MITRSPRRGMRRRLFKKKIKMEAFFTLMFVWLIVWLATRKDDSPKRTLSDAERKRRLEKSKAEFHKALKHAKNAWKV